MYFANLKHIFSRLRLSQKGVGCGSWLHARSVQRRAALRLRVLVPLRGVVDSEAVRSRDQQVRDIAVPEANGLHLKRRNVNAPRGQRARGQMVVLLETPEPRFGITNV